MADTSTALVALLANDAGVSALVGARIAPWQEMQGAALPFIAYTQVEGDHLHSLSSGIALGQETYQFDCVATTYSGARALSDAVRVKLAGFRGTSDTVVIQSCLPTGHRDLPAPPIAGTQKPTYTRQIEFSVFATESIPTN